MGSASEHPEQQEREHLYIEGAKRFRHIPNLAYGWLEELIEQGGLPQISDGELHIQGKATVRRVLEDPVNTPSDPSTYPARLDNGQVVWVNLDERRSYSGHRSVQVVGKPRTVRAILAALTVLEAQHTNIEQLGKLLPYTELDHPEGMFASQREALHELVDAGQTDEAEALWCDLGPEYLDYRTLDYAVALLRYYRPGFDDLPVQQQRDLLKGCCERMNKLLEASRQLNEFLEYGNPARDQRPGIENPRRDVEAAALRDLEGYTYREIAEFLQVKISEKARWVGDYSTIAKMVARGREIVERAFGKEGWQNKVEMIRARLERLEALSPEEQFIEERAEDWGVPHRLAREVIVEGLDPTPEQAKSMAETGYDVESARWAYRWIFQRKLGGDR
jgi:hypothetical protein